jgi:hypothetical protein
MKKDHRVLTSVAAAVIGCLLVTGVGYGQEMEKGQVEATGFAGVVTGIDTHATLGGSLGVAVNERVFAYGEFSYIPLGSFSFSGPSGSISGSARALNFNGGAQYLFNRTNSVVPYAGAGLGLLHTTGGGSTTIGGVTLGSSGSGTDFFFNFGGGLRYSVFFFTFYFFIK